LPNFNIFQDMSHCFQGIAIEATEGLGNPPISANRHPAIKTVFAFLIATRLKYKIRCAQLLEPIQHLLELIVGFRTGGR